MIHILAWIMRIYPSTGKVIHSSLNSSLLISNESVHPGISVWLDLKGQDDATFIYSGSETGWHRLMDDSALFCLTCRPPWPTSDVSGRALAWGALVAFSYQSRRVLLDCSLQRDWHLFTPLVSASFLVLIPCITTACAQLMVLKGRKKVTLKKWHSWTAIAQSTLNVLSFFPLERNSSYL